jgi:tRNA threonylcarbamoyladenosine biosynthesis protein TsaB
MTALLVIDASTYRGTAAVIDGNRILAERAVAMRGEREERLMPAVAEVLRESRVVARDLSAIVCGAGPGSFTSLRIAASLSKGLATATGRPLLAVSSLLLIVAGTDSPAPSGRYLAVLDAMRGDCFAARIDVDAAGVPAWVSDLGIVESATVAEIALTESRTRIGPGQTVDSLPHSRGVARLGVGSAAIINVDVASWEPSYGRLAEAQVRWERQHGRSLGV